MTEDQKQKERDLKVIVADDLQSLQTTMLDNAKYQQVFDADPRILSYIINVISDCDAHNLYELLSIRRFFKLLDEYDIKVGRYKRFAKLYESLPFKGKQGAVCYKLTPVQAFGFFSIYAFMDKSGNRLVRDAYWFVSRKFSKTTQTAAIAVDNFFFGDFDSQSYCASNSYKQSQVLFEEIKFILKHIDSTSKHYKINREIVKFVNDKNRNSLISCLASNPDSLDGLNASLVVVDEYAKAKSSDLKDVLTTSMGTRKNPLTVVITTGSDLMAGYPFYEELEGVKAMLRGEIEDNPRIFASLFMPDVDDNIEEMTYEERVKLYAKVQPHLNVTVPTEYYEEQFKKSHISSDLKLAFNTKMLNIFYQNESDFYIAPKTIDRISRPIEIEDFKGRPEAMCAVDLSESDDFSAITFGIYNKSEKTFKFHTTYFFPSGAMENHPNRFLYEKWIEPDENGKVNLILTEGNVIDYSVLVKFILNANKYLTILKIGYDNWKSHDFVNMLAAAGASNVLQPVSQTYGTFTAPVDAFKHGVETGHIFINDNPVNKFCFGNAVIDYDSMENCKPVKRGCGKASQSHSNKNKIDGVITKLMAMRLFIDYER